MKSHCASGFLLILMAAEAMAGATPGTSVPNAEQPLDVVLVTGERAGPALWKVTSGDHVLWIQGEVGELPERMKWRSVRFEKLLAESQELLIDDSDRVPTPATRRDYRELHDAARLSRGQTLQGRVSPGMYARAMALQESFRIPGNLETTAPWAAAGWVYHGARRSMRLREFNARESATRLARKAKIRITNLLFKPTFAEYIGYLESAVGDDCLSRVVEILDDGGNGIRRMANAWSVGDIDRLRELVPRYELVDEAWSPNEFAACNLGGADRAREYFERRTAAWLTESARVLRDHRSTIAVMPIGWLLAPDGYVAQMRARGYEVVEPR